MPGVAAGIAGVADVTTAWCGVQARLAAPSVAGHMLALLFIDLVAGAA